MTKEDTLRSKVAFDYELFISFLFSVNFWKWEAGFTSRPPKEWNKNLFGVC